MKRKHWVCVYCDKKYYTTCQICPSFAIHITVKFF